MFWFCNCLKMPQTPETVRGSGGFIFGVRCLIFAHYFYILASTLYLYNMLIGGRLHTAKCHLKCWHLWQKMAADFSAANRLTFCIIRKVLKSSTTFLFCTLHLGQFYISVFSVFLLRYVLLAWFFHIFL